MTAPVTAVIGLGCGAFTGGYGAVDEGECVSTIQHALDIGSNLVDVADFYRAGEVERLVGRAITGRRDEALIATRGGMRFDARGKPTGIDGSPEYLTRACDASLRRLSVDHIDLYYLARVDPLVPVEESIGRLGELVNAGKIRQIGLAKASAEELRRAHRVCPISALATEYSLVARGAEAAELPAARELGVTLVACRPLGRGLLTGRLLSADDLDDGDYRQDDERFRPEHLKRHRRLLADAEALVAEKDLSLSRLALAWLLAQPGVVPVPSTRSRLHLEMNAASVGVRLTPEDGDRLTALFPPTLP